MNKKTDMNSETITIPRAIAQEILSNEEALLECPEYPQGDNSRTMAIVEALRAALGTDKTDH